MGIERSLDRGLLTLIVAYLALLAFSTYVLKDILGARFGAFIITVEFYPTSYPAIGWLFHLAFGFLYLVIASLLMHGIELPIKHRILGLLVGVAMPSVLLLLGLSLFSARPVSHWLMLFSIATGIPMIIYYLSKRLKP